MTADEYLYRAQELETVYDALDDDARSDREIGPRLRQVIGALRIRAQGAYDRATLAAALRAEREKGGQP